MKILVKYVNFVKGNKDGRVLFQNFAYLSLLQVAVYIFPLLTMPYLARVIGVEGLGKIAFAAAIMVWMQTIADWGFNYTATRDVAKHRNDIKTVSEIFSSVLYARLLLMLLSLGVLLILILTIPKFGHNKAILLVSFLMIPGHIFFPDWFFQAMERMKFITIADIISKLFFTVAVFAFIHKREDYILQPLFVSLGYLSAGLFSFYLILIKWRVKLTKPSLKNIIKTIKGSFDVFINTIMPNLYNSLSIVLLGFWGGSIANGKFDAGVKLVSIGQGFISIVTRTFFPFLSRKSDFHSTYAKLNIVTSSFMAIGLFILAPFLIRLFFTEEFLDSISVMRICSISLVFLTLSQVYGTNFMIVNGYEHELRKITVICSIIGFLMALPLVYFFSYIGAALVITITRGILGFWTMYTARSKHNIKYE